MRLDRDDLIDGLRDVVRLIHSRGLSGVTIRIVGGAAIRLEHFDRSTTTDIDADIRPTDALADIAAAIAEGRGWPIDWLNSTASIFVPAWGRAVEWTPAYSDDRVVVEVAPMDALLAMKLAAARPGRDTTDIVNLLALNRITSIDEAEELFEQFYPADVLPTKARRLVERAFELGLPDPPERPPRWSIENADHDG